MIRKGVGLSRSMEEELKSIKDLLPTRKDSSVLEIITEVEQQTNRKIDAGIVHLDSPRLRELRGSSSAANLSIKSAPTSPVTTPRSSASTRTQRSQSERKIAFPETLSLTDESKVPIKIFVSTWNMEGKVWRIETFISLN